MQVFKYAMAKGLRSDNPAEHTLKEVVVKQRQRLKLEEFKAIYRMSPGWLQLAMELSLMTLQRVNEIAKMKFSDIKTEEVANVGPVEFLYVVQQKTEKHGVAAHLKIEVTQELKALIQRCRDDIASPYLIHRRPDKMPRHEKRVSMKTKTHYTQVTSEYISHQFSYYRDKVGEFDHLPKAQRPTYHEIRSLGIVLLENQGIDAQALAGHTSRKMTEYYKKGHDQVQWRTVGLVDIKLKLDLN